jgi:hypothetical protein
MRDFDSRCGLLAGLTRYQSGGVHQIMKSVTLVTAALFIVGLPTAWNVASGGAVSAQSLGEIARQETERRSTILVPAKVITEADLKPVASLMPSNVPPAVAATSVAPVAAIPASSMNTPPEAKYVARDASYWLNRMRDLQTRQDRFRLQVAALANRVDSLTRDFDSTWDRFRRGTIESERQMILTERDLVGADLAATNRQIFDLEEEARRSGVPPGWLRP